MDAANVNIVTRPSPGNMNQRKNQFELGAGRPSRAPQSSHTSSFEMLRVCAMETHTRIWRNTERTEAAKAARRDGMRSADVASETTIRVMKDQTLVIYRRTLPGLRPRGLAGESAATPMACRSLLSSESRGRRM